MSVSIPSQNSYPGLSVSSHAQMWQNCRRTVNGVTVVVKGGKVYYGEYLHLPALLLTLMPAAAYRAMNQRREL